MRLIRITHANMARYEFAAVFKFVQRFGGLHQHGGPA
jgi:hypothetical protein